VNEPNMGVKDVVYHLLYIHKTLTSVSPQGQEGAWQKTKNNKKTAKKGGGLAALKLQV